MAAKKTKVEEITTPTTSQSPRPRLHKLTVRNFRCIGPDPVEIELDDIVVLVGPNNAGKSSVLRAYEVVMEHGSNEGKLTIDDFPLGKLDDQNQPTIELETVVYEKTAPGERWVKTDPVSNEMFVREKWTWSEPGSPKKVGWDVSSDSWHASEGPWGAPNIAQAYRPQAHRVGAFQKPEEQAGEVIKLLSKAITDRAKELSKKKAADNADEPTDYERLLETIKQLRNAIAEEATTAVADVKNDLSSMLSEVFPGYAVTFDARPEDDVDKAINIYKPDPLLRMGPTGGFHSTLERQGSGACRTLVWAALRILSERSDGKSPSSTDRPHLLLLDEPEICLHPDAIREACRVLYDLPKTKNWQVMITTHSPVFIDLSRDNTSIARVERKTDGTVQGTTIFRPSKAKLDDDDRIELKLLNICDPSVAEFFFGGRTVLVEGDTEYTAFKHVISQNSKKYKNIHVVRARGKACLVSLCKILNQFDKGFAILHDADREKICGTKTKKMRKNAAWTVNQRILDITEAGRKTNRIRLVASVPNFEEAFFGEAADGEKPYSALARLKTDDSAFQAIANLLDCLVDWSTPIPVGAIAWTSMDDLKKAVDEFDAASTVT
jgi:putative ATP-dependent endonuclease of OLD family